MIQKSEKEKETKKEQKNHKNYSMAMVTTMIMMKSKRVFI